MTTSLVIKFLYKSHALELEIFGLIIPKVPSSSKMTIFVLFQEDGWCSVFCSLGLILRECQVPGVLVHGL